MYIISQKVAYTKHAHTATCIHNAFHAFSQSPRATYPKPRIRAPQNRERWAATGNTPGPGASI